MAVKQLRVLLDDAENVGQFLREIALMQVEIYRPIRIMKSLHTRPNPTAPSECPAGRPSPPEQHLEHPNVLGLLGVYVSNDGTLGIVTEFLPRGSVFDVIHSYGERSVKLVVRCTYLHRTPDVRPHCEPLMASAAPRAGSPIEIELVLRIVTDCARGLEYLHSREPPIIHRDLKSQNLLVTPAHTVKVRRTYSWRTCIDTYGIYYSERPLGGRLRAGARVPAHRRDEPRRLGSVGRARGAA